jgi:hypothetical protein
VAGQFSRRTVIPAIDVIDFRLTQAMITSLLTEFGPEIYTQVRGETVSSKKRLNDLKQFIDANPAHPVDEGLLEEVIVEKAALLVASEQPKYAWTDPGPLPPDDGKFKRVLEQDGFVVTEGALRRTLPADFRLLETESELIRLLDLHNFGTAKGHLEQAFENHARGNWAAANGQLL